MKTFDYQDEALRPYWRLARWVGCGGSYWTKDKPTGYKQENSPFGMSVWHPPHGKLADLLVLPRVYLTNSRMPADFELDKKVKVPHVGQIHIRIYKSGGSPSGGLLRVYMDCPLCGKHIPCGRFWQHMSVHITDTCVRCGKRYTMAQLHKHQRKCNGQALTR